MKKLFWLMKEMWIKKRTLKMRHFIVRLVAPKLYKQAYYNGKPSLISELPRPMIEFLVHRGKNLVGVEIGVEKALNAESILRMLNIKRLFLVDPFFPYEGAYWSENASNMKAEIKIGYITDFEKAKQCLSEFTDKIVFIKQKSEQAVNFIPDDLDFVYIDGDHSYEAVKKDIENYYPKVKIGGILGGHDFNMFDVSKAVREWVDKNNYKLFLKKVDWWVIKK